MNYTLYSTNLVMHQGEARRQMISVAAVRPWTVYAKYPHIEVNCTRDKRVLRNSIGDDHTESLCRVRRTILFADSADLVARKLKSSDRKLIETAMAVVRFDHTSAWSSGYGEELLLTEPYCDWGLLQFSALMDIGIAAIRLPTNLSPYCGRWDPTPGAKPWTHSYLLCDANASECLQEVEDRLNAALSNAPLWNDISGVGYV